MRLDPNDPMALVVPGQGYALTQFAQTGSGSAVEFVSPGAAIGISDVLTTERRAYAAMALAFVSSVAISMDNSMIPVLVPDRLPLQVSYDDNGFRQTTKVAQPTRAPTLRDLVTAIIGEPIEDGVKHPAERLISAFVAKHGRAGVHNALREFGTRKLSADFLRLLSRASRLDAEARRVIVADALKSSDLEIRDAAIQAAEIWHDSALAALLRDHREPVKWLDTYAKQVAADLEA